jgi:3-hydroxymyristoyl/3-hydroxydecanoyl-(acyl carrier protein) dehydratase
MSDPEAGAAEATLSGWTFEIEVPIDSPYFEGHFEAEPIWPGVAHLALLARLYGTVTEHPVEIGEVRALRFRELVRPGDTLEVELRRPDGDGRARFWMRKQGAVASQGVVTWRPAGNRADRP